MPTWGWTYAWYAIALSIPPGEYGMEQRAALLSAFPMPGGNDIVMFSSAHRSVVVERHLRSERGQTGIGSRVLVASAECGKSDYDDFPGAGDLGWCESGRR